MHTVTTINHLWNPFREYLSLLHCFLTDECVCFGFRNSLLFLLQLLYSRGDSFLVIHGFSLLSIVKERGSCVGKENRKEKRKEGRTTQSSDPSPLSPQLASFKLSMCYSVIFLDLRCLNTQISYPQTRSTCKDRGCGG